MSIKQTFFIYLLFFIMTHYSFGMHIIKTILSMKKKFVRNVINRSEELDVLRQKLHVTDTPQDVKNISEGKIIIKEEIPLGKRYGSCHNYAFTKLMGIVGKGSALLKIQGHIDYYATDGINIFNFLYPVNCSSIQPGDIIVYSSNHPLCVIDDITHTGIIIEDDRVESKWGSIHAVFEHPTWYVPTVFGDHASYFRPKITGNDLLGAVQKRLKKKSVKAKYDAIGHTSQQALFDILNDFERINCSDNIQKVYEMLEYDMNIHVNACDANGLTLRMHAKKIGCELLKRLIEDYEKFSE